MSTALSLRSSAHVLFGAADQLAVAASTIGGRGVTQAVRTEAAANITEAAKAVGGMGGPFFVRMAAEITARAARMEAGAPVQPAIDAAMDGASYLLRRASHL